MSQISEQIEKGAAKAATLLPDALMAWGAVAVAYGAWLVYPPAGFIVGGALTSYGGYLLAKGAA